MNFLPLTQSESDELIKIQNAYRGINSSMPNKTCAELIAELGYISNNLNEMCEQNIFRVVRAVGLHAKEGMADFITVRDALNKAMSVIRSQQKDIELLREALELTREHIDGEIDVVDGNYGEPHPNPAMQLATTIEQALAATSPDKPLEE